MVRTLGSLMYMIKANNRDFRSKMDESKRDMNGLSSAAEANRKKMRNWGMAITGASIAIIGATTKVAADFEEKMAEVHTLLGPGSEVRLKELEENVKDMSIATGKSLDDLSGGLYQVISAFGDSADSAAILETNAKAAAAGMSTTQDAINLTSAVTKAYGDTSAEAVEQVADLAFQTVKLGQTTFPELASSIGRVSPMASTLGMDIEELFGTMATLTGVTGDANEVSTQLRGILNGMLKPTDDLREAMRELGYQTGEQMIESNGLVESLQMLYAHTGENNEALGEMFGNVRALTGILPLVGEQADEFARKNAEMYESAGAMNEAFEIQQDTLNATIDRIKALVQVILVDVGNKFLPVIQKLLEGFESLSPAVRGVATTLLALAAGLGIIVGPILLVASKVAGLATALGGLGAKFGGLATVIKTSIIPAIKVGLIPLLKALGGALAVFLGPAGVVLAVVAAFIFFRDEIVGAVKFAADAVITAVDFWADKFRSISEFAGEAVDSFVDFAADVAEVFAELISEALEWGKGIMISLARGIADRVGDALEAVVNLGRSIADYFRDLYTRAREWGINLVLNIRDGFLERVYAVIEAVQGLGQSIADYFAELRDNAVDWGRGIIRGITRGIRDMAMAPVNAVRDVGRRIRDGFTGVLGISSPSRVFVQFGRDIADGLEKGLADVEPVARSLEDNIGRVIDDMAPLAREFEQMGREVSDGLARGFDPDLESEMAERLKEIDQEVLLLAREARHELEDLEAELAGVSGVIDSAGAEMLDRAKAELIEQMEAVRGMAELSVAPEELGIQFQIVDELFTDVFDVMEERVNYFAGVSEDAGESIAEGLLGGLGDGTLEIEDFAQLQAILVQIDDTIRGLGESMEIVFGIIWEHIEELVITLEAITFRLAEFAEVIEEAGDSLEESFIVRVEQLISDYPALNELINESDTALGGLQSALINAGYDVEDFGLAIDWLSVELERLVNKIVELRDEVFDAGRDIVVGLAEGMESAANKPVAAAKRIASAAVKALKDDLKIKSPSLVAVEIGENVGEGLELGLYEKIKDMAKMGEELAGSIAQSIVPDMDVGSLNIEPVAVASEGVAAGDNVNQVFHMDLQYIVPDAATAKSANDDLLKKLKERGYRGAFR